MTEIEEEYFKLAKIGQDAKTFLSSPLGQRLRQKAAAELEYARDELEVERDPERVRDLQAQAGVARRFIDWIVEAIEVGAEAEDLIRDV